MKRLTPTTQHYQWGSRTLLTQLRGAPESEEPEAELWYGAHPDAPSTLMDGSTLLDQIIADPVARLGEGIVSQFGHGLPFLVKLLAAESPLSIQIHPTAEQAAAGFEREEAEGIHRQAPHRSFRDSNHKPELIVAVSQFEALVGFRPIKDTLQFHGLLQADDLISLLNEHCPRNAVAWLLTSRERDADRVAGVVRRISETAPTLGGSAFAAEADLLTRLAATYRGDPGIAVAALLNRVLLEPGQALYLDAGTLHAYAGGLAVEVMANSNNVLRGGLTPKHIDVPMLLECLGPQVGPAEILVPGERDRYQTPAAEFELGLIRSAHTIQGPAIVLSVTGETTVRSEATVLVLRPTEAVWIDAGETIDVESTGTGVVAQANA